MTGDDPEMKELARLYLAGLPARLGAIEKGLEEWEGGHGGAGALDAAIRAAHGIAGSAGTFGMSELGSAAREFEQEALEAAQEQGPGRLARLKELFARMLQVPGTPRPS